MKSKLTDNFCASSFLSIFLSGSFHLWHLLAEYLSSTGLSFFSQRLCRFGLVFSVKSNYCTGIEKLSSSRLFLYRFSVGVKYLDSRSNCVFQLSLLPLSTNTHIVQHSLFLGHIHNYRFTTLLFVCSSVNYQLCGVHSFDVVLTLSLLYWSGYCSTPVSTDICNPSSSSLLFNHVLTGDRSASWITLVL